MGPSDCPHISFPALLRAVRRMPSLKTLAVNGRRLSAIEFAALTEPSHLSSICLDNMEENLTSGRLSRPNLTELLLPKGRIVKLAGEYPNVRRLRCFAPCIGPAMEACPNVVELDIHQSWLTVTDELSALANVRTLRLDDLSLQGSVSNVSPKQRPFADCTK